MGKPEQLSVEVVYALPRRQTVLPVQVVPGTSLHDAILQSGIVDRHPEIDLDRATIGVFGRVRAPGDAVADGDRIEIYRELKKDPREVRRQRARRQGR